MLINLYQVIYKLTVVADETKPNIFCIRISYPQIICISIISLFLKECASGLEQAKWREDTFKTNHQVPSNQTHGEGCTARGGRPA